MKKLLFIFLLVVIVVGTLIYIGVNRQGAEYAGEPTITAMEIDKPDFIFHGSSLSRVEVRAVPTGTEIPEVDRMFLGNATLLRQEQGEQVWIFPIPKEPLSVTEFIAIGYDMNDKKVGEVALDVQGATALYEALWGDEAEEEGPSSGSSGEFILRPGQSKGFGNFKVTFVNVTEDSRCPIDVTCIWAGEAKISLVFESNLATQSKIISTLDTASTFGGYTVSLLEITPQKKANSTIDADEYGIKIRVTKI